MNISTQLKTPKSAKSSIFFRFRYKNKYIKIYTGESIDVKNWSIAKQQSKVDNNLNIKLLGWKSDIIKELTNNDFLINEAKEVCNEIIRGVKAPKKYISYTTSINDGDAIKVEKIEDYQTIKKIDGSTSIKDIINKFVKDKEDILSTGRIKHYKVVVNKLIKAKLNNIPIDEFTTKHLTKFRKHLLNEGLKNDTVNGKIKQVKAPIKYYNPLHPALTFENIKLKPLKHALLSSDEMETLKESDKLTKGLQRVRDIFLFSCLTGQRIGDIMKVNRNQIEGNWWRFRQEKTKKNVSVPLNNEAFKILSKYDYKMPSMTEPVYNRRLKLMLKRAKISRVVILPRDSGNNDVTIEENINELISSHMGRRYFITNELLKGTPINIIAAITGQTIQTLQKYVNTQESDIEKYYREQKEKELKETEQNKAKEN